MLGYTDNSDSMTDSTYDKLLIDRSMYRGTSACTVGGTNINESIVLWGRVEFTRYTGTWRSSKAAKISLYQHDNNWASLCQ